jgi:hypothetical protein
VWVYCRSVITLWIRTATGLLLSCPSLIAASRSFIHALQKKNAGAREARRRHRRSWSTHVTTTKITPYMFSLKPWPFWAKPQAARAAPMMS